MAAKWTLTVDCSDPGKLAAFWRKALGYVDAPPPEGFESWRDWFIKCEVPENEWNDGAALADPGGVEPGISFLKVPEGKVAKNRLHLDIQVGGGRIEPPEVRWSRVVAAVARLTAAGATVVQEHAIAGIPDHVVMADPEGNEFCLV